MTIKVIRAAILRLAVLFAVCFSAAAVAQDFSAIISAPDRTDADRQADKRRDPMKLLEFVGPRPGWRVLDMAVGAGYSTELMARTVQPGGKVIAQDDRASEKFSARMKTPIMSSVEAFVTPFDDLSNPAFRDFDLETFFSDITTRRICPSTAPK
ncbi:putative methyltransferase [Nitrobacteraceae bacterium AZCC 2161]